MSTKQYRKKPLIVEAVQWQPDVVVDGVDGWEDDKGRYGMFVTIHGQHTIVAPGDWLIRESDGVHWYPCKDEIFQATYEALRS